MKWSSINYLKIDIFKSPALILFCLASLTYVFASFWQYEFLALFSKSLIVPSILLYYFLSCKQIQPIVVILFLTFFAADMVTITNPENSLSWVISLYVLGYLIVLFSLIKSLKDDQKLEITKTKIYNIIAFVFIYLFVYSQFIDFIFALQFEYKPLYLIASIVLLLLSILATISFILKGTIKKLLLLLAIFMMISSSFIYVCQIYYVELESLYFWALITQCFYYYFLVNYFLIKNKKGAAY